MAKLVAEFRDRTTKDENGIPLDLYDVAAHVSHQFVKIDPFPDGNGRISRMLMNAVLLKCAGHVVAFGDNGDKDREEYLGLTARASMEFHKEDQEVDDPTGRTELGVQVLKRSQSGLVRLIKQLMGMA